MTKIILAAFVAVGLNAFADDANKGTETTTTETTTMETTTDTATKDAKKGMAHAKKGMKDSKAMAKDMKKKEEKKDEHSH